MILALTVLNHGQAVANDDGDVAVLSQVLSGLLNKIPRVVVGRRVAVLGKVYSTTMITGRI